jgi:hypothetical protein
MSICDRCNEELGCTCAERYRIAELEAQLADVDDLLNLEHYTTHSYRLFRIKEIQQAATPADDARQVED